MRRLLIVAALAAGSACTRGEGADNGAAREPKASAAAAPAAPAQEPEPPAGTAAAAATAASYPAGFPSEDAISNGAVCYLYLKISANARDAAPASGAPALEQAADRWRARLLQDMSESEVRQLTAGDTNFRLQTPAAQRQAAARWCVENAPAAGTQD